MTEQEELEIVRKVKERVAKEYEEYAKNIVAYGKTDIMNKAYEIAHYNEICDFFDGIDECLPFDIKIFQNMLVYEGGILDKIWYGWLNYNHPERYNFFCYEDLCDIICWEFRIAIR